MTNSLTRYAPHVLSVLRVVTAFIFLLHGTQKLLGIPAATRMPDFLSMLWVAGALEIVGGVLLIIGLFTRPTAFVLSGLMAFAYFIAHAPRSIFPTLNGGDAAILYCFVFLYLVFAGPGPWSLDARRR
ncbi:DoxX family protein [Roseococcus suduntuyensis]|uniref:Putative oxidoreductase n=1 Tax=Roseococcus suduntuyensis TaxID=455361 RepID=A0A840ABG4_9PROT|nr:DoxX family protein [Roseococcus suduntuyensis]MBB3899308.1 putative oxidoreductase [Roseococcus suduntuyensis]